MLVKADVQYDRKIRYLDYVENGQRCRGAGFIKLERRDELCNISLQVSGLYRKDRFTRPLLLIGEKEEKELCRLQLSNGGIKIYLEGLNSGDLGGQGISYEQLFGIRIPVAEGKEIQCIWRRLPQEEEPGVDKVQEMVVPGERTEAQAMTGRTAGAAGEQVPRQVAGAAGKQVPRQVAGAADEQMPRQAAGVADEQVPRQAAGVVNRAMAGQRAKAASGSAVDSDMESPIPQTDGEKGSISGFHKKMTTMSYAAFKEDKWEQLWMIYPHVHPFSDEREFLSVSPSDFVLLNRQSYKLVGNSFLLHGFYQFHHLILMRGGNRGQANYYIGVPGNLYERDKKTAIMYGFESFECAKEPAAEGDFGYYMIPVEL